jgi:hypothetical protein
MVTMAVRSYNAHALLASIDALLAEPGRSTAERRTLEDLRAFVLEQISQGASTVRVESLSEHLAHNPGSLN